MSERFAYTVRGARVVFSEGALAELRSELARLESRRALLVTTRGRASVARELLGLPGGVIAGAFDGAEPHVPAAIVEAALERFRALEADCVLALGGGSAVGLGKALVLETGVPLVAVPTTYAGSEMTAIWGITDRDDKRTGRDPRVAPRSVLYDPRLTLTLPPRASAASGMNAIAHCVEALYAREGSPVASLLAEQGLRVLVQSLPQVVLRPHDVGQRAVALRGAHLAGWALDLAPMGLHHRLCHVLGGTFGMPHAETHAVLLPHVVAYNTPAAPEAMAVVARALGAEEAASGLFALNRMLGLPVSLRELGLAETDLDRAAALAAEGSYPNPRALTGVGVRAVLEAAFAGRLAAE